VSARALIGLGLLNLLFLTTGVAVLFAVRGWRSWAELLRLSGLAYLLGLAASGVAFVLELVVGIGLSAVAILVTAFVLAAAAVVAGLRLGRELPRAPRALPPLPALSWPGAIGGALFVVYAEALFRAGRLAGLTEFDAWFFWVPKAKAIYEFGGLDRQFFHELPNASYPPLVPALEAVAFRFMGGEDVVTLHLQFWFPLVAFVGAVLGLLAPRVPTWLLWPPLLLVLVTPHVVDYALQPQADFLLDELFAVAALLLALWLVDRQPWQLVSASILLAAAMLTKREGYLFAAAAVVAAVAAGWSQRRRTWRALVPVAVAAAVLTVPWRLLLAARDVGGAGPEAGGTGLLANFDRAWPSLRLAVSTLFDFDVWLVVIPLAVVAIVLAVFGRDRRLPLYTGVVLVICLAGFTYATWAFPSLPISQEPALNPIVRLTGGAVFFSAALVPLLLAGASRRTEAP
jgi:hypothetical protein